MTSKDSAPLARLAIVHSDIAEEAERAAAMQRAAEHCGLHPAVFTRADAVDAAGPDLVLCLSPRFAKLWRAPSLLVLAGADLAPFHDGAAIVRIMSHDGWLVEHASVERRLRDLSFALRKHRPVIAPWYDCLAAGPAASAEPFLAEAGRPGELLGMLAAGRPVLADAAHPYRDAYGDTIPMLSLDVPEAVRAAQLAVLGAPDMQRQEAARRIYAEHHAPEAQIRTLAALFPCLLSERGYRPDPPALSIAYVVRAGRSQLLPRALGSLAAQGVEGLRVMLVVWRPIDGLDALIAAWPQLSVTVIEAPGARRSAALWRGLAAAKQSGADWFGLLDDDDELLPRHLACMAAAFDRAEGLAPLPNLLHAAALRRAERGFAAPAELAASPGGDEKVRLAGFEIQDPVRLARHRHVVSAQSYIARTALLDADTLDDPGLDVAEDAYLFKLLCTRGLPRFVPEVTSIIHDGAADQSGFARSLETAVALERISSRLLGRSFPYRTVFGEAGALDPLGVAVQPAMAARGAGTAPRCLTLPAPSDTRTMPFRSAGGALRLVAYGMGSAAVCGLAVMSGRRVLAAAEAPTVPLAVPGFWRSSLDLALLPDVAAEEHAAQVELGPGGRLLSLTIENTGAGVEIPWTALPAGRIWIYGAGGSGERAADCVRAATGAPPAGFVDSYRRGAVRGIAVAGPESLDPRAGDIIIIASQYVLTIAAELRARNFEGLYAAYPPLDGRLIYLG
ncbi:MAG: hypothetical protein WDN69_20070 [Aliidongia sp.]